MEENEVVEQEVESTDELDAFDEAWDAEEDILPDSEDFGEPDEDTEDDQQEGQPDDDADEAEESEEPEDSTEEQGDKGEEGNQLFTINFLGNEEKLTLEQMTELAQKGRNYDHVAGERDTLKSESGRMKAFLQKMADKAGVSIEEQMDLTEAMWLMDEEADKGNSLTEAEALLRVQRDRAKPKKEENSPQKKEADKIIDRFLAVYPDVPATDIPKEVWDEAQRTGDLLGAYQAFEIKRLKAENEKIKQGAHNERNEKRSTGPRKTSGANRKKDDFDEGWDSW